MITPAEIIEYIVANGKNGSVLIDEVGVEKVEGEDHKFHYTSITLFRDDLTIRNDELVEKKAEVDLLLAK